MGAVSRTTSTLFVMVGLPASGKTTRAKELEAERRALRLTPDEWMIPLFADNDADGKRNVLEGRFIWLALRALSHGGDVILDFGVWSKVERTALRALAATTGRRASSCISRLTETNSDDGATIVPHKSARRPFTSPTKTSMSTSVSSCLRMTLSYPEENSTHLHLGTPAGARGLASGGQRRLSERSLVS